MNITSLRETLHDIKSIGDQRDPNNFLDCTKDQVEFYQHEYCNPKHNDICLAILDIMIPYCTKKKIDLVYPKTPVYLYIPLSFVTKFAFTNKSFIIDLKWDFSPEDTAAAITKSIIQKIEEQNPDVVGLYAAYYSDFNEFKVRLSIDNTKNTEK